MKIRIVSDIHCDINSGKATKFDFGEDFVICCGDVSGDRLSTEKWINANIKNGIVVAGNHLGYSCAEDAQTKEDSFNLSVKYLQDKFNKNVHFIENQSVEIDDVIFVGGTLFTDYELYSLDFISKKAALKAMNDFRFVKIYKDGKLRNITPQMQVEMHNKTRKYIETVCQNNPDKKIIVVTHHCPSEISIPQMYKGDVLNAAYASSLEYLMFRHENLKLWCHGHVHQSFDYMIAGTRIVANPLGYGDENPNFVREGIIIDTDDL